MRDRNEEDPILKKTWDLLDEDKPIAPSPGFNADFWKRVAADEEVKTARRMRPVFAFPKIMRPLVPALAIMLLVLVVGTRLVNRYSASNIRSTLQSAEPADIEIAMDMELAEDFEAIRIMDILEELEAI